MGKSLFSFGKVGFQKLEELLYILSDFQVLKHMGTVTQEEAYFAIEKTFNGIYPRGMTQDKVFELFVDAGLLKHLEGDRYHVNLRPKPTLS